MEYKMIFKPEWKVVDREVSSHTDDKGAEVNSISFTLGQDEETTVAAQYLGDDAKFNWSLYKMTKGPAE